MKVISVNVNGIRSAARKRFFEWLPEQGADVVCLQETRAQAAELDKAITAPAGYHAFFNDAERKGYSGVALYTRQRPRRIHTLLGWDRADQEGRYIQADFGSLSIVSIYLPSGSSSTERQAIKFDFMARLLPVLQGFRNSRRNYILCGDWNIAHKAIDLKNWRGNQKNSGFLPEERAWMDKFYSNGWIDSFRQFHPEPHRYSWWSQRFPTVPINNKGWRIDYISVTEPLKSFLKDAEIYPDIKHSDHCPIYAEIDFPLFP